MLLLFLLLLLSVPYSSSLRVENPPHPLSVDTAYACKGKKIQQRVWKKVSFTALSAVVSCMCFFPRLAVGDGWLPHDAFKATPQERREGMEKFSFLSFCHMAVTNPSTNQSQRCLTSVISRELICQCGYCIALGLRHVLKY